VLKSRGTSNTPQWGSSINSETVFTATSGTYVDYVLSSDVAASVKRITVMFRGVSRSGTADYLVQLGTSSGITNTGYISTSTGINQSSTSGGGSSTSGFLVELGVNTEICSGHMVLTNITSNSWISSHNVKRSTTQVSLGGGDVSLSGAFDRLRITTTNGTDTFNAGTINILYE
jgi:hypothetical protein